jgi:amidase
MGKRAGNERTEAEMAASDANRWRRSLDLDPSPVVCRAPRWLLPYALASDLRPDTTAVACRPLCPDMVEAADRRWLRSTRQVRRGRWLLPLILLSGPGSVMAQAVGSAVQVHEAGVLELQAAMARGDATAVGLVDAYLARIAAFDQAGPTLNSIIQLNPEARAQAAQLDQERARGQVRGPLHGIPILLKDNYNTRDLPTTGASIALRGVIPPQDATVVRRLRDAGAVILGKTNLHEFAYGYLTISSLGGQTLNPYDPTRVPGGSSGGTGAAIAASLATLGYGSDTCGSIRIPAAFNALFGLRPTKGLTSIAGIMPLAHTQDVVGPLARTVTDLAIGLDAILGDVDPADPATRIMAGRSLPRFQEALRADALTGVRIGILTNYFGEAPEDREVGELVERALRGLARQGAVVVDVALPELDALLAGTSVIAAEFKFDIDDYLAAVPAAPVRSLDEIVQRELHHPAIAASLRTSNAATSREADGYLRSLERQIAAREAVIRFMDAERLDALAYPASRRPPAAVGEPQRGVNCQLSAATGLPALAAPAGYVDGLPIAFELLGRPLDDARLVGLAFAYERASQPRRSPPSTPPLAAGAAR